MCGIGAGICFECIDTLRIHRSALGLMPFRSNAAHISLMDGELDYRNRALMQFVTVCLSAHRF